MRRVALLAALVLVAGCGGTSEPATVPQVQTAVEEWLLGKPLSFKWVYCLRTTRSFEGRAIFRCNVNFGEPHIVRYCATLVDGRLTTNREQPAIRCGRRAAS